MNKTVFVTLLIAIAAIGLSVIQFEKYHKLSHQIQDQNQEMNEIIQTKLSSLQQNVQQNIQQNLQETLQKDFQQNVLQRFQRDSEALAAQEKALLAKMQSNTWVLTEAEYLVHSASLRLQTLYAVKTAIVWLTAALEKIERLNDPKYLTLQESLKSDITKLQAVNDINLSDIWSKASRIVEQINQLPLRDTKETLEGNSEKTEATTAAAAETTPETVATTETVTAKATSEATNTTETASSTQSSSTFFSFMSSWSSSLWLTIKQGVKTSLLQIKDLIKIQYHREPVEPLLTLKEQTLIKENLRLLLEQIRFAILSRENKIYIGAIQESEQWLNRYFDNNSEKVKETKNALQQLSAIPLEPNLPPITALEQFKALRQ